jgi:ABC-type nitrate/sulfonate/bicarbonate transport system substrate-binding protein
VISPSRPRLNPASFRPAGRARPLPAAVACLLTAAVFAGLALSACGGGQPAAAATGAAASSSATAAPEVAEVTLIMDWVPWVLDIPVDVAQEKGFYTGAGLAVNQTLPGGPTDVVKFVATGKAQFGLYYAPDTLMGIGEGAPLLSVAGLMTHAPVGMAMAPGVRASEPADLAGTTAGVVLIPSTRASFATMLETGGVDPGDVKVVDPGFDLVPPLLAGKYESVAVTEFGELVQADAVGENLDYLDFRDWGTPDYAFLNVLTQQGFASDNPATVRAFVTATMAGLDYAAAHPEEAVDIYVKRHPELEGDLLLAQWKAAIPSMAVADGAVTGVQDGASWQSLQDWMVASGLLAQGVDTTAVVTNEYLPEQ